MEKLWVVYKGLVITPLIYESWFVIGGIVDIYNAVERVI